MSNCTSDRELAFASVIRRASHSCPGSGRHEERSSSSRRAFVPHNPSPKILSAPFFERLVEFHERRHLRHIRHDKLPSAAMPLEDL